jgi:hypothetical protein
LEYFAVEYQLHADVTASKSILFVLNIPFFKSGQFLERGAVLLLPLYAFMVLNGKILPPFLLGKFNIFRRVRTSAKSDD